MDYIPLSLRRLDVIHIVTDLSLGSNWQSICFRYRFFSVPGLRHSVYGPDLQLFFLRSWIFYCFKENSPMGGIDFFLKLPRHWQFYLIADSRCMLLLLGCLRRFPSGLWVLGESHRYLRQTWEWGCNGPSCRRDRRPSCRRPRPGSRRIVPARRNDVADAHRRQPLLLAHLQMSKKEKNQRE